MITVVSPYVEGKHNFEKVIDLFHKDIKGKRIHDPNILGDCRGWQIEFFSPVQTAGPISEDKERLLGDMVNFIHHEHGFQIRNPEERTRAQLRNILRGVDYETARGIFEDEKANPHLFTEIDGKSISPVARLFDRLRKAQKKGVQ